MLAVAGGAIKWLHGLANGREAALTKREIEYRDNIERQIADLTRRLARVERSNGVLLGVVHVWIDEIPHDSPSLPGITAQLRSAFPVTEDMPPEFTQLIMRLDGKQSRGARP